MAKKGEPTPPTPPDPGVVANAQSAANIASATAQQHLNMVGQQTPYGSTSYVADPNSPGGYKQVQALDPRVQAIFDAQIPRVGQALSTSLNPAQIGQGDRQAVTDAVFNQAMSRLSPQFKLQQQQLDDTLANQGIGHNSAAYGNAQDILHRQQTDAQNQALYSGIQQGANEQNTIFGQTAYAANQPLNQLTGLLGLAPVSQYTPSSVAPTDVTGAYALNSQVANQQYQAQLQNYNSMLGGLFNMGASALMFA
jgi:hypothetical protein